MPEPANRESLLDNVRSAVAAELTTLPTYLYPFWSIKPASDGGSSGGELARANIMAVVVEEMLHMGLASNLLNALGGSPSLVEAPYLPVFPGRLLRSVSDPDGWGTEVDLLPLGNTCVAMMMAIELPEWDAPGKPTLGEFYHDHVLACLPAEDGGYQGGRQLAAWDNPGPGRLFPIASRADATSAIREILDQGEGLNKKAHDDGDHELAHYWRFREIEEWLLDGTVDLRTDVYPVVPSPRARLGDYSPAQRAANTAFNRTYSRMLDALQETLSSDEPDVFTAATGLMDRLGQQAAVLRQQGTVGETGLVAGPTFEYVPAGPDAS